MTEPIQLSDIKLSIAEGTISNISKALQIRAKILGKIRSYESKGATGRGLKSTSFIAPPFDLAEIARASDVEAYILQSIRKHRKQILKEGYEIAGDDDKMVEYIANRLFEIAMISGVPTIGWLRDLVSTLVQFHNGFIIYRRDPTRSTGSQIRMFGKVIEPIAGIFVGDPTSMEVVIDIYGTPLKWRQTIYNSVGETTTREFPAEDVVHIPVDRKQGFTFGTPYLLPVLDDIRALRKLEEIAVVVADKEAFPLYHYKVGTEDKPAMAYEGGGTEIEEVLAQIETLPTQGFIVTSERHSVELVSRDKASLDINPLLEYFEKRVLSGLSLSQLDIGRGDSSNRGTATNLSKNLEDSAKDYQQILAAYLTQFLVIPLLMEGGFDVTPENIVFFKFPPIDTEEMRATQTHGLQMMGNNAITVSEYRKQFLNKKPMTDEECTDTIMCRQTDQDIKLAKNTPRASTSASSGKSAANAVAVSVRPRNQYGIKPAKSRTNKQNDIGSIEDQITDNQFLQDK